MSASNNVYVKALSKELATAGIEHTMCPSEDNKISIKHKTSEGGRVSVTVATEFSPDEQENYTVSILSGGKNELGGEFSATTTTAKHIIGLFNKNVIFKSFREKAIANNAAYKATEQLFSEYDELTGTKLFICSNSKGKVIFEGERDKPDSWPTKKFKNSFDSFIDIHEYFKAALA